MNCSFHLPILTDTNGTNGRLLFYIQRTPQRSESAQASGLGPMLFSLHEIFFTHVKYVCMYMRVSGRIISPIQEVDSFKYMGVISDQQAHWEAHIPSVCRKVAYGCYSLTKEKQYFPRELLRSLCYVFCNSHISCCSESRSVTYTTYLQPSHKVPERPLKVISPWTYSSDIYNGIFQTQHVLTVQAPCRHKISVSVDKIFCALTLPIPRNVFCFPARGTRHASKDNVNRTKVS